MAYGENHYVEVARKRVVHGGRAKDYLVITRGFEEKDGGRRPSRFVNLPDDAFLRRWLAEALLNM